jgi:predicted nucleic acid-binding protein
MIVADAGPIIAFARIGNLALRQPVVGELLVPDAVCEELVVKGGDRHGAEEARRSCREALHRGNAKPSS